MTAEPTLREATPADRPAVQRLIEQILIEYGLPPEPGATDADLAELPDNYLARGGMFDVLVADNAVIGSVALWPLDTATVELRKMYLAPAWRGRGLGLRLLDHALAWARPRFAAVTLESASVLTEATALYTRYGFEPDDAPIASARCDLRMTLRLDGTPA